MSTARGLEARLRTLDLERVDQLVAIALLVESQLQLWLGHQTANRLLAAVGLTLLAAAIAVRRRCPVASASVVPVLMAVRILFGDPLNLQNDAGVIVGVLLLFYGLGAFAAPRRGVWMLLVSVVITSVNTATRPGGGIGQVFPMEAFAVLGPYALGRAMAARAARERTTRAEAERLESALVSGGQMAAHGERARIARELHDVIAHSVSVMVIQAGGARLVMDAEPARAEASLQSVERAGREALAELRRLLGVLGDEDPHALAPQPGLGDIAPLLTDARKAGIEADLRVAGRPVAVPPALDLCAYRIVQESLTNAIKHAAPATASVNVRWGEEMLELEISDDGRQSHGRRRRGSGGHGIVGMHERVALHSGTLQTGPGASGGFIVRACLPLTRGAAV